MKSPPSPHVFASATPTTQGMIKQIPRSCERGILEQGTGIEPASSGWEPEVLPMY